MSGAVRRGKKNQLLLETGPLGKMKCDSDLASFLPSVLNSSNQSWYQSVQFSSVAQSCLTLCDPMDCIPSGSSIYGILQARILEWVAISFSRGSSQSGDRTQVSHIAGRRFIL